MRRTVWRVRHTVILHPKKHGSESFWAGALPLGLPDYQKPHSDIPGKARAGKPALRGYLYILWIQ